MESWADMEGAGDMTANVMIYRDRDRTNPIRTYEDLRNGRKAMADDVASIVTRLMDDGRGFSVRCQSIRGFDGKAILYVAGVEVDERWARRCTMSK